MTYLTVPGLLRNSRVSTGAVANLRGESETDDTQGLRLHEGHVRIRTRVDSWAGSARGGLRLAYPQELSAESAILVVCQSHLIALALLACSRLLEFT